MFRRVREVLEFTLEELMIKDPLMIFPGYRKNKKKWEQQNIKDDLLKLRRSKQKKEEAKWKKLKKQK